MTTPILPPPSRRKRRRGQNYRLPDARFENELLKVPTDIYLNDVQRARIIEARLEHVSRLMVMGFSETRIAEELGIARSTAHEDVTAVRTLWRAQTIENAEQAAILDLTRIEFLIRGSMDAAMQGDTDAGQFVLKCIQERGNILGYRQGLELDIEGYLRATAESLGFDSDKAVEVAMRIRASLPT